MLLRLLVPALPVQDGADVPVRVVRPRPLLFHVPEAAVEPLDARQEPLPERVDQRRVLHGISPEGDSDAFDSDGGTHSGKTHPYRYVNSETAYSTSLRL